MVKTAIVGFGVQGQKRAKLIKNHLAVTVDPVNKEADYKKLSDVPLSLYKAVFLCVPDKEKKKLIEYCIKNNKHVLVEKPLILGGKKSFLNIQKKANKNNVLIYTAFNHLFEPHLVKLKNYLSKKKIGKIYSIRIFYGNGTARLVKNSIWRDVGAGVLQDLLPHLLITLSDCLKRNKFDFKIIDSNCFENKAPDHITLLHSEKKFRIELEMTLCSWRNTFLLDAIGEKGSIHINRLCKWGPSEFIFRKRKLPSGHPIEDKIVIKQKDPTWNFEHNYFYNSIKNNKKTSFTNDLLFFETMKNLKKLR